MIEAPFRRGTELGLQDLQMAGVVRLGSDGSFFVSGAQPRRPSAGQLFGQQPAGDRSRTRVSYGPPRGEAAARATLTSRRRNTYFMKDSPSCHRT